MSCVPDNRSRLGDPFGSRIIELDGRSLVLDDKGAVVKTRLPDGEARDGLAPGRETDAS
ncbi:MAG: hypothetical protein KJZ59_12975 [Pararhodobacter sp.]|nr:hypothetical protein [Pararhodobacter sp.]